MGEEVYYLVSGVQFVVEVSPLNQISLFEWCTSDILFVQTVLAWMRFSRKGTKMPCLCSFPTKTNGYWGGMCGVLGVLTAVKTSQRYRPPALHGRFLVLGGFLRILFPARIISDTREVWKRRETKNENFAFRVRINACFRHERFT